MAKFKVGDRVRYTGNYAKFRGEEHIGKSGTVYELYAGSLPSVKFDDGTKQVGCYEDNIEVLWVPKVGDRVRLVKDGRSTTGAVGKIATIKAWSNGSFVDNGEYLLDIEPPLTYRTAATPANFTRATIDCFELATPPALTIEAGKFYRTRDGRKVGPMRTDVSVYGPEWKFTVGHDFKSSVGKAWRSDGTFSTIIDRKDDADIIAEWVDEPAVAASSNDNAPKFKVGDFVKITHTDYPDDLPLGGVHRVEAADGDGFELKSRSGLLYFHHWEAIATPSNPAIVCLIENGQPKPSDRPYVHADEGAASTEASRLAAIHKGKQFGVYVLTQTVSEEKVYAHEWQRLAIKGDKIPAIKALKAANDLTLKGAKDAVEHWLATAA